MESFARTLIRFRVVILLAAVIGTAFLASALPQLEADDDVMQFLPQDDPDIQLFNRVNERFGGLDVAIVGLEADTMFTVLMGDNVEARRNFIISHANEVRNLDI